MALSTEKKGDVLAQYRRDPKDTGSPEVQVALLSEPGRGFALVDRWLCATHWIADELRL